MTSKDQKPTKKPTTNTEASSNTNSKKVSSLTRQPKTRSKKYLEAKKKIKQDKLYPPEEAIKLAQSTSLSKFDGKIEAHIVTLHQPGKIGEISFPHIKTADKKIIIADNSVIKDIKNNKIDFDILIATPAFMPKLLPLARILGPKGLMPNPKNGTLTDKPESTIKKLAAAKTIIKTEKKASIIHIVIGQVSQKSKEIVKNLQELIKTIQPSKIKKLAICATMGPSIKVKIEK
ncbi:hypothetical protein KKC08_03010 [Patescibacteria group bacterium]|nr:hypothetical protein [Patescibacteria group bacterium]MCG2701976.1 hypothetical protein [Candidatus Parcubacteria bacterium]MBU4265022.1 hypothetical protein [Patescibacteria group bacterium]MBU4390175.1 hypothetical protein [Patescibacteria group bacterium]MBU4397108.1 hypothetical protein [Patescibacteria group bacterium]